MAILTEGMKQIIREQLCFVATASKEGIPNVSPKGSVRVIDDDTLAFAAMSGKTIRNLEENPNIGVAVADRAVTQGFQFRGKAKLEKSGAIYDTIAAELTARQRPKPELVVRITLTEVYPTPPRG